MTLSTLYLLLSSSPSFSLCIILFFFSDGLCEVQLKFVGVFLASGATYRAKVWDFWGVVVILAPFSSHSFFFFFFFFGILTQLMFISSKTLGILQRIGRRPTTSWYCSFWVFPFHFTSRFFKPSSSAASSLSLVPLSNRCGTLTKSTLLRAPASLLAHHLVSTPFGEQPPCWHIARCLALIPFVTAQVHR